MFLWITLALNYRLNVSRFARKYKKQIPLK